MSYIPATMLVIAGLFGYYAVAVLSISFSGSVGGFCELGMAATSVEMASDGGRCLILAISYPFHFHLDFSRYNCPSQLSGTMVG